MTTVVAAMFVVNLLVLVPVAVTVAHPDYGVTGRAVLAFAAAGILGSLLARVCYFVGIARLGASRTEPLKALFPVVAVGAAVLTLGEDLSGLLLAGVALILAGGVAVVIEARGSPATATGRRLWLDAAFPLSAAVFLGIDPVFTAVGLAEGTPAIVGVTIRVAAATAGFGCYLAWRDRRSGRWVDWNRWLLVAALANTGYLLAYYAALALAPVSVVTPVLGTSTLLVVLGAALFLQDDERVTWTLAGACLLVVSGVLLVVQA